MVAREDDFHTLFLLLLDGTILCFINTDAFIFLTGDIPLQDTEQHTAVQHSFPQVARRVFPFRSLRVAFATHVTSSVATLVEWHEECLCASQFGSHNSLVEIHAKVCQYAVVELEQLFPLVSVIHPLGTGVLYILTCQLVLQFQRHHRDAVDRQYHIDGVMVQRGVSELARTLYNILLILQVQLLVERACWFEIHQLELKAQVVDAVAQYPYQTTLMNLVLQHIVKAVFRLGTILLLIQIPFLRLCQTEELD